MNLAVIRNDPMDKRIATEGRNVHLLNVPKWWIFSAIRARRSPRNLHPTPEKSSDRPDVLQEGGCWDR